MTATTDLDAVIDAAITAAPRSQQVRIGPSEIGTECDRCLGHKLAGTPQLLDTEPPWLPTVGTAVHSWLSEAFMDDALARASRGEEARWMPECRVDVGDIDGVTITGSCDLFDVVEGATTDWKVVGATTLRSAKAGPSRVYRVQAHLYGRGWQRAGYTVRTVGIVYLPRNNVLRKPQTVHWREPYDEAIARGALLRADALAKAIRLAGPERVLPSLTRLPGCLDCPRYPAYPTDPPLPTRGGEPFADLIGTHQGVTQP